MAAVLLGNGSSKLVGSAAHTTDDSFEQRRKLLFRTVEWPEAGHCVGVVEVPGVLRKADEVPDGGIGDPGAAKRRTAQFRGNAFAQECRDVGRSGDRFDRWQAR